MQCKRKTLLTTVFRILMYCLPILLVNNAFAEEKITRNEISAINYPEIFPTINQEKENDKYFKIKSINNKTLFLDTKKINNFMCHSLYPIINNKILSAGYLIGITLATALVRDLHVAPYFVVLTGGLSSIASIYCLLAVTTPNKGVSYENASVYPSDFIDRETSSDITDGSIFKFDKPSHSWGNAAWITPQFFGSESTHPLCLTRDNRRKEVTLKNCYFIEDEHGIRKVSENQLWSTRAATKQTKGDKKHMPLRAKNCPKSLCSNLFIDFRIK